MKRFCAILLLLVLTLSLAACSGNTTNSTSGTGSANTETAAPAENTAPAESSAPAETEPAEAEPAETEPEEPEAPAVMSYAEYIAAELDSPVVVDTYVQATQSWWEDKITVYSQNEDGAVFIYNMACSEADSKKLVPGTKIRVSGYKSEWAGEVEIIDATFEIIDGSFVASPTDVTALLGSDGLIAHQNERVSFKGLTVEPANDAGDAFLYNWDGSGQDGNDLYFNVSLDGATYTFTVESYLCGPGTPVYEAVKALNVGDVVDMEGFLYWYEGVNPHITDLTVTEAAPAVMSYAEYIAADLDTPVVVDTYVQATQSWWEDKITVYSQNEDGAVFIYNMTCSEEDSAKLVPGTKIRVSGYKSEWAGEVEIIDATFRFLSGSYIARPVDVTELLDSEELIEHQNERVSFTGMFVEPANDAGDAFLYNWDGSGQDGNDLYFKVSANGKTYTFTVESYLCGPGTEVYEAVKSLHVGDRVNMEGFLYWYEGVNPHITDLTVE